MDAKRKPLNGAANSPKLESRNDTGLQISEEGDGFLVRGDLSGKHAGLKDSAVWDEARGAWYVTRRRAYEYDHQYGLNLFSKK